MNIDFAFRYLKYFFKAGSRHDVHSPFVYDLVTKVIPDKWSADFNSLESLREKMLKDQSIVSKGDIIDAKKYQILESLKSEYEQQLGGTGSYFFILLGQIIVVTQCLAVLIVFLFFFRKEIFLDNAKITFILLLIILTVLII